MSDKNTILSCLKCFPSYLQLDLFDAKNTDKDTYNRVANIQNTYSRNTCTHNTILEIIFLLKVLILNVYSSKIYLLKVFILEVLVSLSIWKYIYSLLTF